jgi:hypothetical protein
VTAELKFGNQAALCQAVLPVRACAAAFGAVATRNLLPGRIGIPGPSELLDVLYGARRRPP